MSPRLRHIDAPAGTRLATLQATKLLHRLFEISYQLPDDDEDDDDWNQIMMSTQDDAVGIDELIHYGDIDTKIVGVRFYNGMANAGEHVLIRREPRNPYDRNAIRIDNIAGVQIGHIPKQLAAKVARYIDQKRLLIEGTLTGEKGAFDCPMRLRAFGPALGTLEGRALIEMMKADRLSLNAINQREKEEKKKLAEEAKRAAQARAKQQRTKPTEFTSTPQAGNGEVDPTMADILEASERFTPRNIGQATERFGSDEDALAAMPKAHQPDRIATQMLPYQLQALAWLLDKENPAPPPHGSRDAVQLWKRHDRNPGVLVNIATNYASDDYAVKLASGGILADDMGLGKTLEMISLMVSDAHEVPHALLAPDNGATLIVAPLSVMSNWSDQIARHVRSDQPLRVYTYHGTGRKPMGTADFDQYDVVITTYQTLASDYLLQKGSNVAPIPRRSGLYSTNWRRIILDEGHTIRNPQAKVAQAATAVLARSKWVLTGTPIINSLRDLYSLLKFISLTGGLQRLDIFNSVLVRPLKSGDATATFLLQSVMTALCLRRKEEMKFIDLKLPELTEHIYRIPFSDREKERYDPLYQQARGLFKDVSTAGGQKAATTYSHLLEVLLRMRQVCNHWHLAKERVSTLMEALGKQQTVDLTPENRKALQDMLQLSIENQEDCAICLDNLHNPVITTCAHAFGAECITRVIETQHKCPMCRAELKDETVLVHPANDYGDDGAEADELDTNASSSKLEALVKILKASSTTGNKTVVFSQWTRFLDIVQARLERERYNFCRIDGRMPAARRDASLHALESDPKCTIMLASLGVCAVGLNLVAANQIILSDSWWAPAIEDPAVDRVHRLGQKKKTTVVRLIMDGSIEESTLDVQADKRKLMMVAFKEGKGKGDGGRVARLADIERLLK